LPFCIILIAYSGFLFLTSGGNQEKRTKAKNIFKHLIIGILVILGSWLMVYWIFRAFGYDTSRGRGGLSDQALNFNPNTVGAVVIAQNSAGTSTNTNTPRVEYTADSITVNTVAPASSKATITISPKSPYDMKIRMSCLSRDGETRVDGESTVKTGSTIISINLKLVEDTEYSCTLENADGALRLADTTDGEIKTPKTGAVTTAFTVTNTNINTDNILVSYKNASVLSSDAAFLSCKDTTTGNSIFGYMGGVLDRSKGSEVRYLTYLLPSGFVNTLVKDVKAECTLTVYEKNANNTFNPVTQKIPATFKAVNNQGALKTVFKVVENNNRSESIVLVFNGSINIDPNMTLICGSVGSNHIFRAKVAFDATNTTRIAGTAANRPNDGTINAPINLLVTWNGYGLRPDSTYICKLTGKTIKNAVGYIDQKIIDQSDTFTLNTPLIPVIKNPESKLSYYVSIKPAQVVYTKYLLPKTTVNRNAVSQVQFAQAIPDSMFVPVVNGAVVDNSRISITCTSIVGLATGTFWTKSVVLSTDLVSGFSIPITKDPKSGFMHSSTYTCVATFQVERIAQIRIFFVAVPFYFDVTEMGPVVLAVENVYATKDYATFDIIASPRVENSVNYVCKNINGNYSSAVSWPAQSLGVRMPVIIPISDKIPGLNPRTQYVCVVDGVTFQKQKLNYQFIINTP